MSTEFIDVFFPRSSYLLRTRHSDTFQRLFPPDLQRECARPIYELYWEGRNVATIRWPALALLVLFGIAIGLHGYLQLIRRKLSRPPTPSWCLAMCFYATMNTAALGSHCLVARSSLWQRSLVSLDIAATACCAFSALYACVSDELSGGLLTAGNGSRKKHTINLLLGNGILNISAFLGLQVPFMAELQYIGTTIVAVIVVGAYLRKRPTLGRQRLWLRLVFSGAVLALSGMPLDATLCRRLGPHVNHVTLLFAGCHLIMLGLFLYVREELVLRYDSDDAATPRGGGGGGFRGSAGLRAAGSARKRAAAAAAAAGTPAGGGAPRKGKQR